jgi:hypothetical protein
VRLSGLHGQHGSLQRSAVWSSTIVLSWGMAATRQQIATVRSAPLAAREKWGCGGGLTFDWHVHMLRLGAAGVMALLKAASGSWCHRVFALAAPAIGTAPATGHAQCCDGLPAASSWLLPRLTRQTNQMARTANTTQPRWGRNRRAFLLWCCLAALGGKARCAASTRARCAAVHNPARGECY